MGEIAEMMIGGELCEQCGTYLGESWGYARLCGGCAMGETATAKISNSTPKTSCQICGKRVKAAGLKDHMRDAHGIAP